MKMKRKVEKRGGEGKESKSRRRCGEPEGMKEKK